MKKDDILYLVKNFSNLTGLPVRLYENGVLIEYVSYISFPVDPFSLYEDKLGDYEKDVSYFIDDYSCYYCFENFKPYQMVIGPFSHFSLETQKIKEIAFELGLSKEKLPAFLSSFESLVSMPLETILQSLCSFNFIFNGRKLDLGNLMIQEEIQKGYEKEKEEANIDPNEITRERNSTLEIEETISDYVRRGDIDAFNSWAKNAPSIRSGQLSSDYIRHFKNTFIVSITMFSRAAISGGMEYQETMDITDSYIRKCESLKSQQEIANLQFNMVKDFISRVHERKMNSSPLESKIANYVYAHLSERICLDELCLYLAMSKSNLCLRFKQESGKSINDFILEIKVKESLRLLEKTSKSLSSIALYLGFSSQAHFSFCFKKRMGISPIQYRKKFL